MDLRLPIGIIFTIYGFILMGYGIFTRASSIYGKSLGINVNIYWGIILLIFGLVMYYFAKRGKKS